MSTGLYLADGSFKELDHQSLTSEIATRANAGCLIDGTYSHFLGLLPDPDPVLRKRGDEAGILSELAADDQVTAAMLGRKERVLLRDDYQIAPGAMEGMEASETAMLLSNRLNADLERTTLHDVVAQILDAPFYGMVPIEIMWETDKNWWHIKDIIPRPFHWFGYTPHNELFFKGDGWQNQPLPFGKFVVARHHPTFANPYGLRLLSRCLWAVAFKRGGIEFYVRFVEKFGIPQTVAKAPAKATPQEKRKMAGDLARIVSDAVAVLPCGSEVSFETVSGQTGNLHETFLQRWDKSIAKVLSGQTLTLEMEGANSLAASETHAGVAEDISNADMRIVTTVMNEICWLYARLNVGTQELCPVFSYKDIEDLNERADLDNKLTTMGVKFLKPHFINVYKLKEDEFELASPNDAPSDQAGQSAETMPEQAPPGAESPSFSASSSERADQSSPPHLAEKAQLKLDEVIREMLPDLVEANQGFISEIENAVTQAENWEELEFLLCTLLEDKAEPDRFEAFMARAMTAAASYGAGTVQAEEEEDA